MRKLAFLILFLFIKIGYSQNQELDPTISFQSSYYTFSKKDSIMEVEDIAYHSIDNSKKIITSVIRNKKNEWVSNSVHFLDVLDEDLGYKFFINEKGLKMALFVLNESPSYFTFLTSNKNERLTFYNLEQVENELVKAIISSTKEIIIEEIVKDIEYSEYYRKKAYKKAIEYIKKGLNKQKCKMISQGTYNPILVRYIGSQGFLVKFYCEFDCNQNYINPSYFWVEAFYIGNGKWDLELVDQKLTH
ncbi:MAG: hypothetical protein CSA38_02640 [Flavobacteriales bacterium]|nr:MAG: hypothetical protein CSA38_02640 [Flavobacteriales bacterium]